MPPPALESAPTRPAAGRLPYSHCSLNTPPPHPHPPSTAAAALCRLAPQVPELGSGAPSAALVEAAPPKSLFYRM